MLIRLRYGRHIQTYLKVIACVMVALFYVIFLFRESLNAIEQNKDRMAAAGIGGGAALGISKQEFKPGPIKVVRLFYLRQRQQQKTLHPTTALAPRTIPSTLNPVYEYSEEIHSATEKDLQQRRDHLNTVCKRHNLQSHYPPLPWEFFISPGHNLVWCNVFKAASSAWMYYFNLLGGYDIKFLQRTKVQPITLARNRFPTPKEDELFESLPSSVSFLFVREPFERLVSAYRDKLEGGRIAYYKPLVLKIIRKRVASKGRHIPGPTFTEFIRFLVEEHTLQHDMDEHWTPVYRFCTPCTINFTIIGKMETFNRDSEFIIRQAGLESLLLGKMPKHNLKYLFNLAPGRKSNELVERYFSQIQRDLLDQLLNIYRLDFELFNYSYTKYYDIVQQQEQAASVTTLAASGKAKLNVAGGNATSANVTITTMQHASNTNNSNNKK